MADMRRLMASLGFSGLAEPAERKSSADDARNATGHGSLLGEQLAGLAGIVQEQVVPRLVEAHRPVTNERLVPPAVLDARQSDTVEELADLVVRDGAAARAYVTKLQEDGMPIEGIYLNVLAPAARLLGKLWETDTHHFADVTVGVGRLQQMLHDFEVAFQSTASAWQPACRILLMPAPEEQHTFGLFMLGEFMRRAGWDAWTGPLPAGTKLRTLLSPGEFSVVGFSASSDRRLDELTEIIKTVRRLSKRNPVYVMVGGGVFMQRPGLVAEVGADGTAGDAREAIKLAHALIDRPIHSSGTD